MAILAILESAQCKDLLLPDLQLLDLWCKGLATEADIVAMQTDLEIASLLKSLATGIASPYGRMKYTSKQLAYILSTGMLVNGDISLCGVRNARCIRSVVKMPDVCLLSLAR